MAKVTKCRRNIAENYNRLSKVHERYRRQTTDRRTGNSKATFANDHKGHSSWPEIARYSIDRVSFLIRSLSQPRPYLASFPSYYRWPSLPYFSSGVARLLIGCTAIQGFIALSEGLSGELQYIRFS